MPESSAQLSGINKAIAKNRKGDLIIKAKPGSKVLVEQLSHEFWFGCEIDNNIVGSSRPENELTQYKGKFLKNFNSAVTGNALKWGSMERVKGKINYSAADDILHWTEENNIPLRGHNLFWGVREFVQPWVKELSDSDLRQTVQNRAETIAKRYKGRFAEYDLNNEMIHGNYYEERLGPEITKLMAQWVHNGDPEAKLFLNDYDIATGKRLADYMAHIRKLLKQGVPIAGIGVQGHSHGETFDRYQLKNALDSLALFKLPIRITEFNMPGQNSKYYGNRNLTLTPQEEQLKANEIVDFYKICFAHPGVEAIIMWGFWEGDNWIPVSSLYKRDWTPNPAAEAYQNLIFKEWWTNNSGKAGKDGVFITSAFFGIYKVTIDGRSKEINLTKKAGKVIVDFTL